VLTIQAFHRRETRWRRRKSTVAQHVISNNVFVGIHAAITFHLSVLSLFGLKTLTSATFSGLRRRHYGPFGRDHCAGRARCRPPRSRGYQPTAVEFGQRAAEVQFDAAAALVSAGPTSFEFDGTTPKASQLMPHDCARTADVIAAAAAPIRMSLDAWSCVFSRLQTTQEHQIK
jgi:hypothetical protein